MSALSKDLHGSSIAPRLLEVDLQAIAHNIACLQAHLGSSTALMPIIKADGYGCNAVRVAEILSTPALPYLGVAYISEALSLRAHGMQHPLFCTQPSMEQLAEAIAADCALSVCSKQQVQALAKESRKQQRSCKLHLKINTGMNRFGCSPEEALNIATEILASPFLSLEGLLTHFAVADNPDEDAFTLAQIQRFDAVVAQLKKHGIKPRWIHAANSAALLRFHLPQYNLARPGLSCVGVLPSTASFWPAIDLKPATTLSSQIVHINTCHEGDTVSYSRSYTVRRPIERIAAIPIGYADGMHWLYKNRGHVMVHGQVAPLVGNICMDSTLIDISDIPAAKVGDRVLIYGKDKDYGVSRSVTEAAEDWGTIPWQLLVASGPRVTKHFI